jgi:serine/threonine-protein phosphatase 6 catalytic subunit
MRQSIPDKWITQLLACQHLPEADMKVLCDTVRTILMEESNIQPVSSPVTICGDIHGQFWDLLELLRKGGMVPETSYIFMVGMIDPLFEMLVKVLIRCFGYLRLFSS